MTLVSFILFLATEPLRVKTVVNSFASEEGKRHLLGVLEM